MGTMDGGWTPELHSEWAAATKSVLLHSMIVWHFCVVADKNLPPGESSYVDDRFSVGGQESKIFPIERWYLAAAASVAASQHQTHSKSSEWRCKKKDGEMFRNFYYFFSR